MGHDLGLMPLALSLAGGALLALAADPAELLAQALMSWSDGAWDKLRPYSIRRIVERHPTEVAKVVLGEREFAVR